MPSININKIYSPSDLKIATQIAKEAEAIYNKLPCGIKFKSENVRLGMSLMFSKQYEAKVSADFWDEIQDNEEAYIVMTSILNCTPKTCNKGFFNFTEFPQFYFRYLFRMCHAKFLADTGKNKDFISYLNDNERVRRIIRPKYGVKIAPLVKLNTEIFRNGKKMLS